MSNREFQINGRNMYINIAQETSEVQDAHRLRDDRGEHRLDLWVSKTFAMKSTRLR